MKILVLLFSLHSLSSLLAPGRPASPQSPQDKRKLGILDWFDSDEEDKKDEEGADGQGKGISKVMELIKMANSFKNDPFFQVSVVVNYKNPEYKSFLAHRVLEELKAL